MLGPGRPVQPRGRGRPGRRARARTSLLQDNPLVLFHPPMLYLGLVGFTLPFAFAVASLVTGRVDEDWQGETRRWTLFAWTFLTIGIVLGAWWSYQVLGWGGFWAWDPVENASLLPWLVGTAYLHSVMVQQRRGLLRVWNLSLVIATFSLTILGHLPHPVGRHPVGARLLRPRPSARSCSASSAWCWPSGSASSPGGATACARRAASTRRSAGRAPSWPTTSSSCCSPSWSCSARSSPSSTRRSTAAPRWPSAPPTSTGWSSRSDWPCSSSWPWPRPCRGASRRPRSCGAAWPSPPPSASWWWWAACSAASTGSSRCSPSASAPSPPPRPAGRWCSRCGAPGGRRAGAGRPPARAALAGWRGFVGRANGGMVVHIGVVVIAVGLAAATAFGQRGERGAGPGPDRHFAGHTVEFVGHPRGAHAVPRRPAGPAAGRRRGGLHPGHQPVRRRHPGRGHAGHRLQP